MTNLIICSMALCLAACTGPVTGKHSSTAIITDIISNTDTTQASDHELAKMYSRAISDYILEVSKQKLTVFDTLFFGKRNNGQPDDFPNIILPETINHIQIRLIDPEVGKKQQAAQKSSVYINLMGWVDPDKAEFIFVTFSNGFEHQFDCHIEYKYDSDQKAFELTKSQIEIFKQ